MKEEKKEKEETLENRESRRYGPKSTTNRNRQPSTIKTSNTADDAIQTPSAEAIILDFE